MKLYNSIGPNPQVVRMFLAELGQDLETIEVDLMAGENRQEEHLKRNPSGQNKINRRGGPTWRLPCYVGSAD